MRFAKSSAKTGHTKRKWYQLRSNRICICYQQIYRLFAIYSGLSPANLPNICYLQSTVTSKFTEYLLLTVDCHQQIYRFFAIDSRLSPATPITLGISYLSSKFKDADVQAYLHLHDIKVVFSWSGSNKFENKYIYIYTYINVYRPN